MAKKKPLTDVLKERIIKYVKKGHTDKEICKLINVSQNTFYIWLKHDPLFSEALHTAKYMPDFKVECQLYKRAVGFKYDETMVEEAPNGTTTRKTTKLAIPDVRAQQFWLANRRPERWANKKTVDNNIKADISGMDQYIISLLKDKK